jgi:DtxR family transcriptional regulator, Mn-dependent transcriptional regulator
VRRLVERGLVEMQADRSLRLTEAGRTIAVSTVRRHRLAERLLVDVIGLEWEKVHREADRWEHVISDDVEERLVVLLGHPTTCPHGNPIPGAARVGPAQHRLDEAQPGDRIRLERITESVEHETDSLSYLGEHGLTPGTTVTVGARAPDGTLTLVVGEDTIALGPAMTQRMFVASA